MWNRLRSDGPHLPPGETRAVIFHSNDVHGKIDRFAKIAAILDRERQSGAEVFYFSAGDNFTGNPSSTGLSLQASRFWKSTTGSGCRCSSWETMSSTTAGNGSIASWTGRPSRRRGQYPAAAGALAKLRPSIVLETKNGLKIAVFGVIQIEAESRQPSTSPERIKGFAFRDPFTTALEMKSLRRDSHVLIALTHLGYDQDRRLAERMPELDVIIGGHSHTRIDPAERINGVLVAQAGSDNRFLGRVELLIRGERIVEKKGTLIDLQGNQREDRGVKDMIAGFNRNPALTRRLARRRTSSPARTPSAV